ncbi:tetratricopeptide repeat protein [Spirosoma endophyticum]|uniref:Uncharacterized protein n=1 Tax=Spirosoma endophyticum TaxID=662367 RepID=A0A1I1PHV0_9BACT|nr:hypothetical protein [Spirosoma endophyticum]SFD09375.1 hypothetical protein SAMN05216167_103284 [Spirosoma endophyticum]
MNVRINLIHWTLVALPLLSAAQPKQFITSARSGDTAGHSSTTAQKTDELTPRAESTISNGSDTAGGSINTLPLFGERPKTAAQISEEIHFLNDCDRNFSSRPEASEFFAARGWDYVTKGQLDTATHRFNLSWLLNDKNADSYWGLGVVCYQKNQLPSAIRMLKKGLALADSNIALMTDLATLEIKHYQEKPDINVLADAEGHLQKSIALSPNSAIAYQKLSVVYYLQADYPKAWDYFHQAYKLDLSGLDLAYLNELSAKLPDPKGVFK